MSLLHCYKEVVGVWCGLVALICMYLVTENTGMSFTFYKIRPLFPGRFHDLYKGSELCNPSCNSH